MIEVIRYGGLVLAVVSACGDPDAKKKPECLLEVWTDADGDGYGDPATGHISCEGRPDEVQDDSDCDDTNADVNPGEDEACDAVDNDCDLEVDEGFSVQRWHPDDDGDGHGDLFESFEACEPPAGATLEGSDCNDDDPEVYPGNREVCDGKDNDCDTRADDEDSQVDLTDGADYYIDGDNDGYGRDETLTRLCADPNPGGTVTVGGDCNDDQAAVNPDGVEVCNQFDDDCDGLTNEDDDSFDDTTLITWCRDADSDGFGDSGTSVIQCDRPSPAFVNVCGDCNDADPLVGGGC